MKIPKIIHQVYEDLSGPPEFLRLLSKGWQEKNPDWEYMFWTKKEMEALVREFPDFVDIYHSFPYNIQRWDALRYLILYKYGGLYVDMDYECIRSINPILEKGTCFFGLEPKSHAKSFGLDVMVGNAFMASTPQNQFIEEIINEIKGLKHKKDIIMDKVMNTTGPLMITELYFKAKQKFQISLVPSELVTPLTKQEVRMLMLKKNNNEINAKINDAYAIHYFFSSWLSQLPSTFEPFIDFINLDIKRNEHS